MRLLLRSLIFAALFVAAGLIFAALFERIFGLDFSQTTTGVIGLVFAVVGFLWVWRWSDLR